MHFFFYNFFSRFRASESDCSAHRHSAYGRLCLRGGPPSPPGRSEEERGEHGLSGVACGPPLHRARPLAASRQEVVPLLEHSKNGFRESGVCTPGLSEGQAGAFPRLLSL